VGDAEFTVIYPNGDTAAGLLPVDHEPSDRPLDGALAPMAYVAHAREQPELTAGVWGCDAGTLEITDLPFTEVCVVIDGLVEVTDRYGNSAIFKPGEAFVLHAGFTGRWHMPTSFRKYNCMIRRPESHREGADT